MTTPSGSSAPLQRWTPRTAEYMDQAPGVVVCVWASDLDRIEAAARAYDAARAELAQHAALVASTRWLINELQAPDDAYRLNEADKAMDAVIAALANIHVED